MKWISVKDSLPEADQTIFAVIATVPGTLYTSWYQGWLRDTIYPCIFKEGKFIKDYGTQIPASHWMPKPPPTQLPSEAQPIDHDSFETEPKHEAQG